MCGVTKLACEKVVSWSETELLTLYDVLQKSGDLLFSLTNGLMEKTLASTEAQTRQATG